VLSLGRRSHSRLLVLPIALSPWYCFHTRLSHLHSVSGASLRIALLGISVPCTSVSSVLGVSLPLLVSDLFHQLYPGLFYHQLHITTLPLSSTISLLFLPTTQPLYRKHTIIPCGTELFSAIHWSEGSKRILISFLIMQFEK
jgi:hypothetical protein